MNRTGAHTRMIILIVGTALLGGCAAGSATAGYAAKASTADDIGGEARQRIVNDATAQSKSYTDAEIAKLRAELRR